jgi:hypothetical protein
MMPSSPSLPLLNTDMSFIIEDYKAISDRQIAIAIEEGQLACPACQSSGWHQFCDEEGGLYYSVCEVCRNPFGEPQPMEYHG